MRKSTFALACASLLSFTGVAGAAANETRTIPAFRTIGAAGGSFDIIADASAATPSLSLEGAQADTDRIETRVEDGELRIRTKSGFNYNMGHVTVHVGAPGLTAYAGSGSTSAKITGVQAASFIATTSGSGGITLSGRAHRLQATISGSGSIDTRALNARLVELNISGSGDATVFASDTLSANIAGSGHVTYYGSPRTVNRSVSGSGSIDPGR